MIVLDTNILVYAHREELPKHESAKSCLVALAEGAARWAIPVFCIGEFLRVVTHPRLFTPPHTPAEGCRALERFLESPSLAILHPEDAYLELLREAVLEADAIGNLVFDAQIVALCRQTGAGALLTEDRDFDRFNNFQTLKLGDLRP